MGLELELEEYKGPVCEMCRFFREGECYVFPPDVLPVNSGDSRLVEGVLINSKVSSHRPEVKPRDLACGSFEISQQVEDSLCEDCKVKNCHVTMQRCIEKGLKETK